MSSSREYRADIDGLRAVAILSVLLYHVGIPGLSGGFVGVDVFFVISGYLISRNILSDIDAGSWSFRRFYIHRARRLLPAFSTVLLVTFVMGALLFAPAHFKSLSQSSVFAVFSLSNVLFWRDAGYFDLSADLKPLLHTWSLSVEEQFYLVWPMLLVLLSRHARRFLPIIVVGLGLTSFLAAQYWLAGDSAAAFFLTPFRLGEFAIGAAVLWLERYRDRVPLLVLEVLCLVGLALIAFAVARFDPSIPFPGLSALVPSLGAGLAIFAGARARSAGLLRARPVVFVGLISYSLYLVHWPVLVYLKYWTMRPLVGGEQVLAIMLSFVLAVLLYRYIERPFRSREHNAVAFVRVRPGASFAYYSVVVCILLLGSAGHAWANKGWAWRLDAPGSHAVPEELRAKEVGCRKHDQECRIGAKKKGPYDVLVIGDSHAGHLTTGLDYIGRSHDLSFRIWTHRGCPPVFGTYKKYGSASLKKEEADCMRMTERWERSILKSRPSAVIIASRWDWLFESEEFAGHRVRRDFLVEKADPVVSVERSREVFRRKLGETVRAMTDKGIRVVLFSQAPPQGRDPVSCAGVPSYLFSEEQASARCDDASFEETKERLAFADGVISDLAAGNPMVFPVILSQVFCDDSKKACIHRVRQTELYKDDNHINSRGSMYVARAIESDLARFLSGGQRVASR